MKMFFYPNCSEYWAVFLHEASNFMDKQEFVYVFYFAWFFFVLKEKFE